MKKLQYLSEISQKEFIDFLENVDIVLFDIEGTLLLNRQLIPTADKLIIKLRNLNKKIGFVSNNGSIPTEKFCTSLKELRPTIEEFITPNLILINYLKRINFNKDIFIITSNLAKKVLKEAGYKIIEYSDIQSNPIIDDKNAIENLIVKIKKKCNNVGLLYVDFSVNMQFGDFLVAQIILQEIKDVIFAHGNDEDLSVTQIEKIIGPKFYIDALEKWSNRKALRLSKPSAKVKEMILEKYDITNNVRVLFVGDTVEIDVAFGINSGFKTCLVLTGSTKKEEIKEKSQIYKADYIATSVDEIFGLIDI